LEEDEDVGIEEEEEEDTDKLLSELFCFLSDGGGSKRKASFSF
jgi:hypothetical protein